MVQKLSYQLDPRDHDATEVVVCPAFTALRSVQTTIDSDRMHIKLGAQDVYWEPEGAFTGEVSAPMLAKLNVSYVIVGHSERRQLYGETNDAVAAKYAAALSHGLEPILCVGETLAQREAGHTEAVVAEQLDAVLLTVGPAGLSKGVLAYEPVWAIGTGKTASPAQAQAVHKFLRGKVAAADVDVANGLRILYGGSVKASNAETLFAQMDIDGGLVGGASLQSDEFLSICLAARPKAKVAS